MHCGSCIHRIRELQCKQKKMAEQKGDDDTSSKKILVDLTSNNSFFQNSSSLDITGWPFNSSELFTARNVVEEPTISEVVTQHKPSNNSGGITCCVPQCFNNSKRNSELSFYVIPKDPDLRKRWLINISRKNFKPTSSHRVCSAHFEGGKKTYMNNVPTIVPKLTAKTPIKERNTRTSLGMLPQIFSPIRQSDDEEEMEEVELTLEQQQAIEIQSLSNQLRDLMREKEDNEMLLKEKIKSLENELQRNQFTVDRFKHNKYHFKFYTGFESYELFKAVLDFLNPDAQSLKYWGSVTKDTTSNNKLGRSRTLSPEDEFFITLVRLRVGLPILDLAIRINMSESNVSRILITWFDFLHIKLRSLPIWATKETVQKTMPKCFKELYPKTRVIIDCTEIFTQMPTSYRSQSATFSNYKHHNTAKALVGIAPSGSVTFVSNVYAGRSSDKQITRHCGIVDLLEPGDDLMADRGFEIEDLLPTGTTLNIPPFLEGAPQLTLEKEVQTRRIASVRVHVERAIERVKNYRILQQTYQLSMAADLNKIWIICCYLVNFLPPLISEDSEE